ncbi:MAG: periplasmic heavy metal sensor [Desulfobacterales bacterium]
MKKLNSIVGIALLSALIIVPAAVWANGWGMGGGHMMGWGGGPGYYDQDDRGNTSLNGEQQRRFADLDRKFYEDTKELREKLWTKSAELNELLSSANPESGKAVKLQKEISDLRARLDEKGINREIETRKIAPDARVGSGNGYGHMGGGYAMGYGPGGCIN